MLDTESKRRKEQQKQKVKKRYNVTIDPENYMFIPAKKQTDYYDNDVNQRVAIYVRVSTDDVRQTTSYELQKKYYEEFVTRHPNWTLVKIYADEGISGTSLKKRDEFNRMIADCRAGKIDMIITKSVSRFARNVEDFIGTVRNLAELKPRVGVFFESEAIFSLNDDSQMALTFQATMAEEESHTVLEDVVVVMVSDGSLNGPGAVAVFSVAVSPILHLIVGDGVLQRPAVKGLMICHRDHFLAHDPISA